jgi:dTDP-glucose 4,6-dehydratase
VGHPNATALEGDILTLDLRTILRDANVVVHAAAILGVDRVCSAGRETMETNYVGTSRLLKALDASPNLDRFVYFSTSEVFGINSYRVDETIRPTVGPIAESRWSYAMSKLAGEHLVASYFRETRLPVTIVRPFNIFGPRRTGDYALRRFIISALRGDPVLVHGDGTQIRAWCYIEDFCFALLQMIARKQAIGEDFNIGNPGNTVTVSELAQKVISLARSSSRIEFRDSPFPDISIRVPSLEKAKRLLEYTPQYDLNTGLKLTIEWYARNLSDFVGAKPIASPSTPADARAYAPQHLRSLPDLHGAA